MTNQTTINQVAVNVLSIMASNNIKNGVYVHPKTGKNVSPFGHTETQGNVDNAFLSITPECRLTNAIEMIKYIALQPANMASSASRQLAARNRGCTLEGHDARKAWKMASEKITYLGNVNKHSSKNSMFWKQFSSLHGENHNTWQVFQAIVNEFSKIRNDVMAMRTALIKNAASVQVKTHCLEIAEVCENILTVEKKLAKTSQAEIAWQEIEAIPISVEKAFELAEKTPVSAKTIIRRK
jgi:hypothetical protein